jgi:hypothetical protein
MDYKTGAQAKTSVFHRQFAHSYRFAYSIVVIKYYSPRRVSTTELLRRVYCSV